MKSYMHWTTLSAFLLFAFGSSLRIEDSGVVPIHRGDILILFYLTVENNCEDMVHVEARGEHCCDVLNPEDPFACEFMRLTGGHMGQFAAREIRNITLFYITPIPHGRRGRCEVELWYGRPGGDTKALNHRISFDTLIHPGKVPPALVADYYDASTVQACQTNDLDPLDGCEPVDCRMKYGGVRPFFLREEKRCVVAPDCSAPDQAYDPADNACRDLGAGLSEEDERVLRQPGGPPLDANAANAPCSYEPRVRCHHGRPNPETGLCECDEGWSFAPVDSRDALQPSTFVMHLCTERRECETFLYDFALPILLGVVTALLIALFSVLAYLCWLRLCAPPPAVSLEAPICVCSVYDDEDEQDDDFDDSPSDLCNNFASQRSRPHTSRMVYSFSQEPSGRGDAILSKSSNPRGSSHGQGAPTTLKSLPAPDEGSDKRVSTGKTLPENSITESSFRHNVGPGGEVSGSFKLRSRSNSRDTHHGGSELGDSTFQVFRMSTSGKEGKNDAVLGDSFIESKRERGFEIMDSVLRRGDTAREDSLHGESMRGSSLHEESVCGEPMRREPILGSTEHRDSMHGESIGGESLRGDPISRTTKSLRSESQGRDLLCLKALSEEPYTVGRDSNGKGVMRSDTEYDQKIQRPSRSAMVSSPEWENDKQREAMDTGEQSPTASWSPVPLSSPVPYPVPSPGVGSVSSSRPSDSERVNTNLQAWRVSAGQPGHCPPRLSSGGSGSRTRCSTPCSRPLCSPPPPSPSPPPRPDRSRSRPASRGRSPSRREDNAWQDAAPCRFAQPCVASSRSPTPPSHHFTYVGPGDTQGPVLCPPCCPTDKSSWQFQGPCDKRNTEEVLTPCEAYQPDGWKQRSCSRETVWYPNAGDPSKPLCEELQRPPPPHLAQQLDEKPLCTPVVSPGPPPLTQCPGFSAKADEAERYLVGVLNCGDKGMGGQVCPAQQASPTEKCRGVTFVAAPDQQPCRAVCCSPQPLPPEVTVSAPAGADSDQVVYLTLRTQPLAASDDGASGADTPRGANRGANRGAMTVQLRQTRTVAQEDTCACPMMHVPCQNMQTAICAERYVISPEKPCASVCTPKSSPRKPSRSCVRDCPVCLTRDDEFWEQFMPRWRELRSDTDDSR